jgi:hypothetical protein
VLIAASRRIVTLVVLSFAKLGFLAVPIGDRTGYQHARDLLRTKEAATLGERLLHIGDELRAAVFDQVKDVGALKEEPTDTEHE